MTIILFSISLKQGKLLVSELQSLPVTTGFPGGDIKRQSFRSLTFRLLLGAVAKKHADSRQQLLYSKGLSNIVVGTKVQPLTLSMTHPGQSA
jgi:hypothetical protein